MKKNGDHELTFGAHECRQGERIRAYVAIFRGAAWSQVDAERMQGPLLRFGHDHIFGSCHNKIEPTWSDSFNSSQISISEMS